MIEMTSNQIDEYITNKSKNELIVFDDKQKMEIIFLKYIYSSKNNIYFRCKKRSCGLAKINIKIKYIIIYKKCNKKVNHFKLDFEK